MPFGDARSQLDSVRKQHLDGVLLAWEGSDSLRKQAAANLLGEAAFENSEHASYLASLADEHAELRAPHPRVLQAFERQGKPFLLAGAKSIPTGGMLFGRAILLRKFARYLSNTFADHPELNCVDEYDQVIATLRTLDGNDATFPKAHLRCYFAGIRLTSLGRGAVFATFVTPIRLNESPWERPVADAHAIRSAIALGEDPLGEDYLLFTYNLPPNRFARVPTSASPGWSYQRWYRPNPNAQVELHGWTSPIDPGHSRRPEVVHEELLGATVVFPLSVALA